MFNCGNNVGDPHPLDISILQPYFFHSAHQILQISQILIFFVDCCSQVSQSWLPSCIKGVIFAYESNETNKQKLYFQLKLIK